MELVHASWVTPCGALCGARSTPAASSDAPSAAASPSRVQLRSQPLRPTTCRPCATHGSPGHVVLSTRGQPHYPRSALAVLGVRMSGPVPAHSADLHMQQRRHWQGMRHRRHMQQWNAQLGRGLRVCAFEEGAPEQLMQGVEGAPQAGKEKEMSVLDRKVVELRLKEIEEQKRLQDLFKSPFSTMWRLWRLVAQGRMDLKLIEFPKLKDVVAITLLTFCLVVASAIVLSFTDLVLKRICEILFARWR